MRHRQRGFSVVLMLALIVLVGGMLAYTVSLGTTMHASVAQEIAAARAAQAAQAAVEWGKLRVRQAPANCATANRNLTIPLASGAVPVTVTCRRTLTDENGTPVSVYQITATACRPAAAGATWCPNLAPAGDYVERVAIGSSEP